MTLTNLAIRPLKKNLMFTTCHVMHTQHPTMARRVNGGGNFTCSHASADNLTYGSSPGDATVSTTVSTKEDPSLLEASMYEVPFSAVQSTNGSTRRDHKYELTWTKRSNGNSVWLDIIYGNY